MKRQHAIDRVHTDRPMALVNVLNARLADTIDLALMTKQAHWNVRGPQFHSLHSLFDDLRSQLDEHTDALAERIVQLGGSALGTSQSVSRASQLGSYPVSIRAGSAHLEALHERYRDLARRVRVAFEVADSDDPETADLLTDFSRSISQAIWFIEAHLQDDQAKWNHAEVA